MNEQIGLFSADFDNQATPDDSDSFGCCHRFRECSDAGRCLVSDAEYASLCLYRKNLESGKIFYGKNAVGFSMPVYEEFRRRIDGLTPAARSAFDSIVIYICEFKRAATRCIVRNEHIRELSSVGLFNFRTLGSAFPALCAYKTFLGPRFENTPLFKRAQEIRTVERKPLNDALKAAQQAGDETEQKRLKKELNKIPGPKTKDFLCQWLNSEAIPLRDILASPYRFAERRPDCASYLEEYYQDTLFSGYESRIYPPSPFAADGLLSLPDMEEEELWRVELSRGYSPEEKARRIGAIEAARAARAEERRKDEGDKADIPPASEKKSKKSAKKSPYKNLLWDKMCVITGVLSVSRSEAFFDILKCGGQISDNPVSTMDILILGRQEWTEMNNGIASRKVQKAAELRDRGKDVQIVSEDEFYAMVEEAVQCKDISFAGWLRESDVAE